ncbi:hypothetical protein BKA62DRAFT_660193 [Auriculariales sp. MPI-PUGE-AT-0066]|nr:hypothetical protein BKA62DRAFT_660193 [Auriculariales sp. MPI-PUGE-AT-0066]
MLATHSSLLAAILLAVSVAALPRASVPHTLLTARGTDPIPDDNGHCPEFAQLCDTGGCCLSGTFCQATDEEGTVFECVTDRDIPGSTPTIPDDNDTCPPEAPLFCPTGGCCKTECLATDDEGTVFVCAPETKPVLGGVSEPYPDTNGVCEGGEFDQLCPTGGCCGEGSFCAATDEEGTVFVCATDRDIPGSTPPTLDDNGTCSTGSELCPTGGCCATSCAATDDEGTIFVCTPPARLL